MAGIHLTNSFFAPFDKFNYSMDLSIFTDEKAADILLHKIYDFNASNSFNFSFFKQTHKYFMSP